MSAAILPGADPLPMPAAEPIGKRWAILRVCSYCKSILGAKCDVTGEDIPLAELVTCCMHLNHNALTGGVCDACQAGNVMATFKATA